MLGQREALPSGLYRKCKFFEEEGGDFSSIKKKKSSPPPIEKPELQEEQKQKLPTIPKHSIRYELNERAKERRKKPNLMKNAKI